jgi:hypothetical protein
VYTVQVRARGADGTVVTSPVRQFKIDQTPPVSSARPDDAAGTVTLRAADGLSGLSAIEYSLDGGATWLAYSSPIALPAGASVAYRSRDAAGNVETVSTYTRPVSSGLPPGCLVSGDDAERALAARATAVVVGASASSTVYGKAISLGVKVIAAAGGATGEVRIIEGDKELGKAVLVDGKATVVLPKTLAAGSHTVSAVYSGSVALNAGSDTAQFTVTKAAPTVRVKATSAKKSKTAITVKVATSTKAAASGKVKITVKRSGKTVATKQVRLAKSTAKYTVPKKISARGGKLRIVVSSPGTANISKAKARAVSVRVS